MASSIKIPNNQTVYVKNIPLTITEDDICSMLQDGAGEGLLSIAIMKRPGFTTAFAFVNFSSAEKALGAIKCLHEASVGDQILSANLKSEKKKKVGSSPVKKAKNGKQAADADDDANSDSDSEADADSNSPAVGAPSSSAFGAASSSSAIAAQPQAITPPKSRGVLVIDGSYCLAEFNRLKILDRVDWKRFLTFLETRLNVDFGTRKFWFDSVEGPTDFRHALYRKLSLGAPFGPGIQTKGFGEHSYKYKTTRCCKQPNAACIHKKADGTQIDINYKVQKGVDVSIASSILVHAHYERDNPDCIDTVVLLSGDGDLRGSLCHARQVLKKTVFIIGVGAASVHTDIQQLASENIFLEEDGLYNQILTQKPLPKKEAPKEPKKEVLKEPQLPQAYPQLPQLPQEPKKEIQVPKEPKKEVPEKKKVATDQAQAVAALALIKNALPIHPFTAEQANKSSDNICEAVWQGKSCSAKCTKVHMWAPMTTDSVLKNSRQIGRICLSFLEHGTCPQYQCRLLHVLRSELHLESMTGALRAEGAPKITPVACFAQCNSACANTSAACPFVHIHWDQVQQRVREEFVKESERISALLSSPSVSELTTANSTKLCKQFWWESQCSNPGCTSVHAYMRGFAQAGQDGKRVIARPCPFIESKEACPLGPEACPFSHILPRFMRFHCVLDSVLCPAQALAPYKCAKSDRACSLGYHIHWAVWSRRFVKAAAKKEAKKKEKVEAAALVGAAGAAAEEEDLDEEIVFQPEDEENIEGDGAGPSGSSSPPLMEGRESPVLAVEDMSASLLDFSSYEDIVAFVGPSQASASAAAAPVTAAPTLDDLMSWDDECAFEDAARASLEELGFDDSNPFSYYGSPSPSPAAPPKGA